MRDMKWLALLLVGCGSVQDAGGDNTSAHAAAPGGSGNRETGGGGSAGSNDASGGHAGSSAANVGGAGVGEGGGRVGGGGAVGGGTGDSGTNDSATPIVVTPCPSGSGGAVPVGTWVNITPPEVIQHPTYTNTLVPLIDPSNPSIVYITTDGNGIFKSVDCGANWHQVNTGTNGDQLNKGRIWSAALDPINPGTIYALTGYGPQGLWKTIDGGVNWAQTFPVGSDIALHTTGFVERVSMDPTDHLHIMVDFHQGGTCSGGHTPICYGESKDGGQTWTVVDFPAKYAATPAEANGIAIIQGDIWLSEEGGYIFRTEDAGKNWTPVTPTIDGNAYIRFVGGSVMFKSPEGSYYLGSQQGVIRSDSAAGPAAKWSLLPNSGGWLSPVMGDGSRLFTAGWPGGNVTIWAASYGDPTKWTELDTPGLPKTFPTAPYDPYVLASDDGHHLLYMTLQHAGLWRVQTQ